MRFTRLLAAAVVLGATCWSASGPIVWAHDEFRFVGVVVKLEAPKNRVSITFREFDGKQETVWIAILPKSEITRDQKPVPKTDLKPGVHVVVDALGDDYDNLDAVAIRIVPPPKS